MDGFGGLQILKNAVIAQGNLCISRQSLIDSPQQLAWSISQACFARGARFGVFAAVIIS
jgi:hypothetical protein